MHSKYYALITLGFVLSIFLVLFVDVAETQDSSLQCSPFNELTGIITCTEVKPTYNTTMPLVLVRFPQPGASIDRFSLVDLDTGSLVDIEKRASRETAAGGVEFEFGLSHHIRNSDYQLFIDASNLQEIKLHAYVNFSTDVPMMDIWVVRPGNKHVSKPTFAVSPDPVFDLEIGFERNADCKYGPLPFNSSFEEAFEMMPYEFSPHSSGLSPTAIVTGFSVSGFEAGYAHDGSLVDMHVLCREPIGVTPTYSYELLKVGSDGSPPIIGLSANPSMLRDITNRDFSLNITTDDRSVCTVDNVNLNALILSGRIPGYNFSSLSDFRTSRAEEIRVPSSPRDATYRFSVNCENLAGRESLEEFEYSVILEHLQDISLLPIESPTNRQQIDIHLTSVFGSDTCYYSVGHPEDNEWVQMTRTGELVEGRRLYTVSSVNVDEGEQAIYVTCDRFSGHVSETIIVDRTPPTDPVIEIPDYTCDLGRVYFQLTGSDENPGLSGFSHYEYNITAQGVDGFEDEYWSGTTSQGNVIRNIPGEDLEGGALRVMARAFDRAGNPSGEAAAEVIVSDDSVPDLCIPVLPPMDLWVNKPANNHVSKPLFAVSPEETFDLEIGFERPANCKYSFSGLTGTPEGAFDNAPYWFNHSLSTPANPRGVIKGFSMENHFSNYPHDGTLRTMYIICNETADSEGVAYESAFVSQEIYIGSDTTPPVISLSSSPGTLVDIQNRRADFLVETDDLSVCTIRNTNPPQGSLPVEIVSGRAPGYDFYLFNHFNISRVEQVRIPSNPLQYTYEFNITCQNLANLESSVSHSYYVNFAEQQDIIFLSPAAATNKTSVVVNISTPLADDTCYYSVGNPDNGGELALMTNTRNTVDGRTVFTARASLEEGKHTLYASCDNFFGFETRDVHVDTTPPSSNITMNSYTCSYNELSFTIQGEDDENGTGLDRFYYNVTYHDDPSFYSVERSASAGASREIKVSLPFDENFDGGQLRVWAWATDNVGNVENKGSYRGILLSNDSIPECDFTPPTLDINDTFDEERNEWTVLVDCEDDHSGCKGEFRYSIHTTPGENCTYDQSRNLLDPIFVTETSDLCVAVYDRNDNNNTARLSLPVDYPLHCFDENGSLLMCGGDCPACGVGEACEVDSDCKSNYCLGGVCTTASCEDGIKNGLETGVDCGGPDCPACEVGLMCKVDGDCVSGNCVDGICEEPSCTNNKRDGLETDVDCGGPVCNACERGMKCVEHSDCETNYCSDGKCELHPEQDTDGDGLPDWWEEKFFGCITCADPDEDSNNDGKTNMEHFLAGTDPTADPGEIPKKEGVLGLVLIIIGGVLLLLGILLVVQKFVPALNSFFDGLFPEQKSLSSEAPKPSAQPMRVDSVPKPPGTGMPKPITPGPVDAQKSREMRDSVRKKVQGKRSSRKSLLSAFDDASFSDAEEKSGKDNLDGEKSPEAKKSGPEPVVKRSEAGEKESGTSSLSEAKQEKPKPVTAKKSGHRETEGEKGIDKKTSEKPQEEEDVFEKLKNINAKKKTQKKS